jgi:hypothetical protein
MNLQEFTRTIYRLTRLRETNKKRKLKGTKELHPTKNLINKLKDLHKIYMRKNDAPITNTDMRRWLKKVNVTDLKFKDGKPICGKRHGEDLTADMILEIFKKEVLAPIQNQQPVM